MVYLAMTTEWPSKLAQRIAVVLHKKYALQDMVAKVELSYALNSIVMKKKDDPGVLLKQISGLQNRYNTASFQVSTKEQIATVLDKALMEYSTVLICEQMQKGSSLSMTDLQLTMKQSYRTLYSESKGGSNEMPEVGLADVDGEIKCYNCGKKGHKAFQCKEPKKKKGARKRITRSAIAVVIKGMMRTTAGMIPTTPTSKVEVLLMASGNVMHFPKTFNLLLDPDVWVTDTGASCDSTSHVFGLTNKHVALSEDGITLLDGSKKAATMIADMEAL
eukprot:4659400-Ditylum_brightwellii.AAC.1